MVREITTLAVMFAVMTVFTSHLCAQPNQSWSWVDVGRGHSNAGAGYDAPLGFAESESRVGDVNLGRGFAVGVGPDGLTLSHSIGVGREGVGVGHNFQLSVGRNGTHVGHSGVMTAGGDSRVLVGGQTHSGPAGVGGGNYAQGYGQNTHAWSQSRTRPLLYRHRVARPVYRRHW